VSDNPNLIGGYELKNCVATGASTQIWEVAQQGSTVPFAMKLLLPDSLKDPEKKSILKQEFKVGSLFEHPNLVRFHKLEMTRDHGFFIMDYFRAPSLKTQISANRAETQAKLKKIVEAACQAFVYMNEKGWLHRDIKPDNILVNKTGELRIIDFSLATRIVSGVMKLVSGNQKSIMGTRTYIAPETILKKSPTIQSDIYSFGVTLFEIATGSPPFAGLNPNDLLKKHLADAPAPPSVLNPNAATELDSVILKMLSKKPADRYADFREVMSAFRNINPFKEDPVELYERRVREAKASESLSVDKRLDSRADADRVSRGIAAPARPTKGKRMTAPIGEMEAVKKTGARGAAQPAPQAPMSQMPMGQMPMGQMPGMMMPQMQMPYGMPGMYPGMMMPQQQMPPQMAPPGTMPGMPLQMPPPSPGQQPGPGNAAAQPPAASKPPVPAPAVPPAIAGPASQKPATSDSQSSSSSQSAQNTKEAPKRIILPLERRSAADAAVKDLDAIADMDFMTDLPDVL
jgi:predicted Ser/Thr protein kinase